MARWLSADHGELRDGHRGDRLVTQDVGTSTPGFLGLRFLGLRISALIEPLPDAFRPRIALALALSRYRGWIVSLPMNGRSTSGTVMEPSACWWFSRMAIMARLIAMAVPLSV